MSKLHEKAIRLVEGGHVQAEGLWVRLIKLPHELNSCGECNMDSLCHKGNEICDLCIECEGIIGYACYLELVNKKK